ncbi:MAG: hydrolase TatD [Candidatus Yanofskybacteria bacterium CG10_big_fil_rev_8_21_14_0_10_46_23]|uniref:Hydrolase TatD n=1 Tax=Candidatus Yanofskybacteria bacterium CG10_big_fil_rev_8_21_14_0_10_46_23 TaxID=1975098 RepID=A0A2H0R3L3_9BACT|nr:MAG: hydrolase TatD [Candidatus Yanofskybacteria bacterium CG10_big_fil_rev_8_21_14_0_10_46_23]
MINLKLIDSHCHPQFPQYDEDRAEVLNRALEAGVGLVCVGTDFETSRQAIELAEERENVWASVGLHPTDIDSDFDFASFADLFESNKVVAIGEIGLDYYRIKEAEAQDQQRLILRQWLREVEHRDYPLILHCRDDKQVKAYEDLLEILDQYGDCRGVIHSFTGSADLAREFIDRGFHIGLNGIVTFSEEYMELIEAIPLERLLLETDAPFLSPAPYRGQRNEPFRITNIAEYIAKIRGEGLDEIQRVTKENTLNLFNLK